MIFRFRVHESWTTVPHALARILTTLAALERPRQPGDDGEDLSELLDGMDDPEPQPAAVAVPAPHPAVSPAIRPAVATATPPARVAKPFDGIPTTGRSFYRWCTSTKQLPRANAIGKREGWPRLVSDWEPDMVSLAYGELTALQPSANGR
jgi:hypothetical protein